MGKKGKNQRTMKDARKTLNFFNGPKPKNTPTTSGPPHNTSTISGPNNTPGACGLPAYDSLPIPYDQVPPLPSSSTLPAPNMGNKKSTLQGDLTKSITKSVTTIPDNALPAAIEAVKFNVKEKIGMPGTAAKVLNNQPSTPPNSRTTTSDCAVPGQFPATPDTFVSALKESIQDLESTISRPAVKLAQEYYRVLAMEAVEDFQVSGHVTSAAPGLAKATTTAGKASKKGPDKGKGKANEKTTESKAPALPTVEDAGGYQRLDLQLDSSACTVKCTYLSRDECACPSDCSWVCLADVFDELSGHKKPEEPNADVSPDLAVPFEKQLLLAPEWSLQHLAQISQDLCADDVSKITKGMVKRTTALLQKVYPPRAINISDALKASNLSNKLKKKYRNEWAAAAVTSGEAITFSKDIVKWINWMHTIKHSYFEKLEPFVMKNGVFEPIWFHTKNGQLIDMYKVVAFHMAKSLMWSKKIALPWPPADAMLFALTERAVVGMHVDEYRHIDGLGRREGALDHWTSDEMSKEMMEKIVAEMTEGGLWHVEEGLAWKRNC